MEVAEEEDLDEEDGEEDPCARVLGLEEGGEGRS